VGRHRLRAGHQRLLRSRALATWDAEAEGVSVDEAATQAVRIGLEEGRWQRLVSVGRKYGRESGYTEDDVESVIQSFRNENRGR
jgi:hypothetical protein